jgi:hypothetical protein
MRAVPTRVAEGENRVGLGGPCRRGHDRGGRRRECGPGRGEVEGRSDAGGARLGAVGSRWAMARKRAVMVGRIEVEGRWIAVGARVVPGSSGQAGWRIDGGKGSAGKRRA